jgi:hypothetical protein
MTANVDAMVRAGVEAYRAGKRAEARTLLERAIELDNYNEMAWMWLSAVVESPEEQLTCLENVVVINPDNERAKQGLRSLGVDPDTIINADDSAAAEEAPVADAFQEEDLFTQGATKASTGSAASEAFSTDDLFADTDFSADQPFEFDDNLFAEDNDGDLDDEFVEDTGESYAGDANVDDEFADDGLADEILPAGDEFYADKTTLEEFSDAIDSSDIDDYDEKQFQRDPFAPEPVREAAPDPQTFFSQIPLEIEIQRLPGTDDPTPNTHYAIMGGLGLVNLIAVIFIIMQFIG